MNPMLQLPAPLQVFYGTPRRFLWHPLSHTAVLSDLHLGAEISLALQGIFIPDQATPVIRAAWTELLRLGPRRVIIAGDLFDSPEPPESAIRLFHELLAQLPTSPPCPVTLTLGNHDPPREFFQTNFPTLALADAVTLDGLSIFHGHARPRLPDPRGFIVGHQHPAVVLTTRLRSAKMICYVTATLRSKDAVNPLVILPAFSPLPLGTNLLAGEAWILDLPQPQRADMRIAGLVEPARREPQVLDFGTLSEWV